MSNAFSSPSSLAAFSSLLGKWPGSPSKWTKNYHQQIVDRLAKRLNLLKERLDAVVKGRVVPDVDDLAIGSGRQCRLAIMFLDICDFSGRPNWQPAEQKEVLALMNLFMAEMIIMVRDF